VSGEAVGARERGTSAPPAPGGTQGGARTGASDGGGGAPAAGDAGARGTPDRPARDFPGSAPGSASESPPGTARDGTQPGARPGSTPDGPARDAPAKAPGRASESAPGGARGGRPPGAGPGADDPGAAPDELLAARAAEGDETAFEVLVRRHTPALLRLARRLLDEPPGGGGAAEDAVQDAFVVAWRRLPEFRGDAAFGSWMYRILTNRCLNVLRARRGTQPLESVPEPPAPEHQASPARAAESAASLRALSEALSGLTPEQRACWVLRELHGLSYEEIAAAVGIGEPAVRGRIFRARRHLTEAMRTWR
jgi:RNA polymerase sigma-70 factor (ECF subfamily)